jgi:hypothetical protein
MLLIRWPRLWLRWRRVLYRMESLRLPTLKKTMRRHATKHNAISVFLLKVQQNMLIKRSSRTEVVFRKHSRATPLVGTLRRTDLANILTEAVLS